MLSLAAERIFAWMHARQHCRSSPPETLSIPIPGVCVLEFDNMWMLHDFCTLDHFKCVGLAMADSDAGIAATSSLGLSDLEVTRQRFKDLALQNHRRALDPTTEKMIEKLRAGGTSIADPELRRKAQTLTTLVWRLGGNTRHLSCACVCNVSSTHCVCACVRVFFLNRAFFDEVGFIQTWDATTKGRLMTIWATYCVHHAQGHMFVDMHACVSL